MTLPAHRLHLECPTEQPLTRPFRVQGWIAAAAPIGAVGGLAREWLNLTERPDVRAALPEWPHAVGFSGQLGPESLAVGALRLILRIGSDEEQVEIELPDIVLPPDHLQTRQVGGVWGEQFFAAGRGILDQIRAAFEAVGHPLESAARILDFGCGCGRVVRGFAEIPHVGAVHGCDIDAEAIAWNRGHLAHLGEFTTNPTMPPTAFPDGWFEAIYSVSVFTHLPEPMQHAWIRELHRITRPGGVVLLSLHGERYWRQDPGVTHDVETSGFAYRTGAVTAGLPDFYMVAYHSIDYVRRSWSDHFDLMAHHPSYIDGAHDAVVLRRR